MTSIVLIADDHPLMRQALRLAIERVLPASAVIEAGRYEEAIDQLQAVHRDCELVLLDLNMPGIPGFGGLLALRGQFPAVPVIVISAVDDESTMARALDYGAAAFVSKSAVAEEIAEAVHAVLAGRTWLPPRLSELRDAARRITDEDAAFAARVATLTPQQLRVLLAMRQGRLNKQIAYQLGISTGTTKTHVTAILRKLGVGSRTQAVIAAARLDVLPGDPVIVTEDVDEE